MPELLKNRVIYADETVVQDLPPRCHSLCKRVTNLFCSDEPIFPW